MCEHFSSVSPPSDIPADEPLLVSSPPNSSLPSSSPPDLSSPDIRPSRSMRHTEKGIEWQAQLLQTREHAKIQRQTPAARSAADATALMVAHAIAPADEYFSLDSMDSLVTTSYPTVFLMQAFPYRSSVPRVWDLSKPLVTYQEAMAHPDCDAWWVAMDTEKSAMDDLGVFDPAPVLVLPKGKKHHWVALGFHLERC